MTSRESYVHRLDEMRRRVKTLGDDVDTAMRLSIASLRQQDALAIRVMADGVINGDNAINSERLRLEEDTATLIATEQPVAGDLRLILAGFITVNELERMGDHAKGIARIAKMLSAPAPNDVTMALTQMADLARDLLQQSLAAFGASDADAARAIAARDDELDTLYERYYAAMLTAMRDGRMEIESGTRLLWAAHNLERIGDRIVNICERTIYIATGHMAEIQGHLPTR